MKMSRNYSAFTWDIWTTAKLPTKQKTKYKKLFKKAKYVGKYK